MTPSRLIDTYYSGGMYAREWRMGYDGNPCVVEDAHQVSALSPEQKLELERRNALVKGGVQVLERYRVLVAVAEPPEEILRETSWTDTDGTEITTPSPEWERYDAAQAELALLLAADELPGDTPKYDLFLRGEPDRGDAEEPSAEWVEWDAARQRYLEVVANVLPSAPSVLDIM